MVHFSDSRQKKKSSDRGDSYIFIQDHSTFFRSSPESNTADRGDNRQNGTTASGLFHLIVPLLKCEISDMRDTIVNGLGYTNPVVFK